MTAAHVRRAVGAAAILAAVLGACEGNHFDNIVVENHTPTALHFVLYVVGGGTFDLGPKAPAGDGVAIVYGSDFGPESLFTKNGCTVGDLVALDPLDHEVARRKPPLCARDTWVIEAPGPSPT